MGKVIVTGGLGALGRAVVEELCNRDHEVAVIDIASGEGEAGCGMVIGGIDLAEPVAVERAYAKAAEAMGGVDGLVNVAGGFTWEQIETGTIDSWDAMYRLNVRTAAISSRAVLSHMTSGAIVNVGAAAASPAGMGMAPYAAAKAGVMALTESLAEELKERGIRVNAVLPTVLDTPANRRDMPDADPRCWVTPQSAAKVIAFLLSSDSSAVSGTGIRLSNGIGAA